MGKATRQKTNTDFAVEMVDNPSLTDGLMEDPNYPRKTEAVVNLRTMLGGFCRFHGTLAQKMAARRFKALCERSTVGDSRAVDPAKEPVDGGGVNPEYVIISGAEAREELARLYTYLGRVDYDRFHFVVARDYGPTAYARFRHKTRVPGGKIVSKYSREIYAIADRLCGYWGLEGQAGSRSQPSHWDDGSGQVYSGEVSTRRSA